MRRENEKLIIDGNAIYELDLECVRRKNQQKDKENEENQRKKNGRCQVGTSKNLEGKMKK